MFKSITTAAILALGTSTLAVGADDYRNHKLEASLQARAEAAESSLKTVQADRNLAVATLRDVASALKNYPGLDAAPVPQVVPVPAPVAAAKAEPSMLVQVGGFKLSRAE